MVRLRDTVGWKALFAVPKKTFDISGNNLVTADAERVGNNFQPFTFPLFSPVMYWIVREGRQAIFCNFRNFSEQKGCFQFFFYNMQIGYFF